MSMEKNVPLLRIVTLCCLLALVALPAWARRTEADVKAYIERYQLLALEHEMTFHIPACITLAQGLLESDAGLSELASKYNNHFGIKSFNWRGQEACYGDSSRRSCYRVYGTSEDSFLDHAKFLRSPRYDTLYRIDINDYRAWAEGLRRCGYAEDRAYPQKLIALIERYKLNELSTAALSVGEVDRKIRKAERDAQKTTEQATKQAEKERLKQERELAKQQRSKEQAEAKRRREAAQAEAKAEREQKLALREQERERERAKQQEKRAQEKRERAERFAQRQAAAQRQKATAEAETASRRLKPNPSPSTPDRGRAYASADND